MCGPLAAMAALSIASSVMQYQGQAQQAKQQDTAARTAYNFDMSQLQERQREQGVQEQQQMSQRGQQALMARASLRAAGAEGGVSGNSIDRIQGANDFAYGQDLATMTENARNTGRQDAMSGIGYNMQAQSRLNQIQHPSLINTGLQIAGIGINTYDQYKKTT